MIRYLTSPSQMPRIIVWLLMLAVAVRTINLTAEWLR